VPQSKLKREDQGCRDLRYIFDKKCDECVRCLPRALCVSVIVTPPTVPGTGTGENFDLRAEGYCCEKFNFQLFYFFEEPPSISSDPPPVVREYRGSGACATTGFRTGVTCTLKPIKIDGHCYARVSCQSLLDDYLYVSMETIGADGKTCVAIPEINFTGTNEYGFYFDVTIKSDNIKSTYIINPNSLGPCAECSCATMLPVELCAILNVNIPLGYGDPTIPGFHQLFPCGHFYISQKLRWDCDVRKWLGTPTTIGDNTYEIVGKLHETQCAVIFTVNGGPFIEHDVSIGGLPLPANTAYHYLETSPDPCFPYYRCRGEGWFLITDTFYSCVPDPLDDNYIYTYPNPSIDFTIPSPFNEPQYGEHTFPPIGRLRIKSIPCGGECTASDSACEGACPALGQQDVFACGDPAFNIACEISAPGCTCGDGTVFTMYPGTSGTGLEVGDCHFYTTGSTIHPELFLRNTCFGGTTTISVGLQLSFFSSLGCTDSPVNLAKYRLSLVVSWVCPDATNGTVELKLSPNSSSTCSPLVLEFDFPISALTPSGGACTSTCSGGGTGTLRITL